MKVISTLFQNSMVEGLFFSTMLWCEYNNAQVHRGREYATVLHKTAVITEQSFLLCLFIKIILLTKVNV